MKIRKQHIWIFIVVAVLVFTALSIARVRSILNSPGVHQLFDKVYINMEEKCYYFDAQTREYLGQGTVTIKGQGKYTNFFDGVLSLPEYANPEIYMDQQDHPDIPYYKIESMVLDRKDKLSITYTAIYERNVGKSGEEYQVFMCNYWYVVKFAPDWNYPVIRIRGQDGTDVVAVCGESETDALERFMKS